MKIKTKEKTGNGYCGWGGVGKALLKNVHLSILVTLSFLLGAQLERYSIIHDRYDGDVPHPHHLSSSSHEANINNHHRYRAPSKRPWPSTPEESAIGFWENGWRSIEIFQGERKQHPDERNKFFGEGQEQAALGLLRNKRGGTFLDMASHDAVKLSNTYALERQYGWTGICVEANPVNLADLAAMRTCQVAMAAIGSGANRMESINFALGGGAGGLGGIVGNGMDNTQTKNRGRLQQYYTVPLLEILERFNAPNVIDYLSLDIEGAEYYVMEHFPLDSYTFKVMTVERPEPKLMALLLAAGYKIVKKIRYDVLFVHESILNEIDFSAVDVTGPDENQSQTKWQLVPPITTDPKFASR